MTTLDTAAPVPPAALAVVRFTGPRPAFTRMMIRGALLQAITLGIYRFWLTTDARRFLWANTEIDGDSLDYTGTAIELLLGFLIALAILVPIYVLFAIAGLELGLFSQLSGVAGFVFLTGFTQFAIYRARRYRLTRTVYRGIRFNQDGSAASYAVRAMLWWIPIGLTLGLAYPFAQASLERYKIRHTLYGDLRGEFTQTGRRLFLRGISMWLLLVVPTVLLIVVAVTAVDWSAIEAAGGWEKALNTNSSAAIVALSMSVLAGGYPFVTAFVLYPAFQGVMLKWWLSGLRFGPVTVTTTLRKRQLYGPYLRFFLLLILLVVVVIAAAAFFGFLISHAGFDLETTSAQIEFAVIGFVSYIIFFLVAWVGYQVVIKLAMWRITCDSVALASFAAIDMVHARGEAASSVGEGLADALGAGGF